MKTEYTEELVKHDSFLKIKNEILGKTNSCAYGVYKKYDILVVKVEAIESLGCEVKIRVDFVWMINSSYYKDVASVDIEAIIRT